MRRPTAAIVIAWVWIVLGGLACLGAVWGACICAMMFSVAEMDPPPERAWFSPLLVIAVAAQTVVGVLGIVAGIHFLKLRRWARTCLEALSWFVVISLVGYTIFWVIWWFTITGDMGAKVPGHFRIIRVVAPFMGVLMTGAYVVPFVLMIRSLRSMKVRAAVGRATVLRQKGETDVAAWGWTVCPDAPAAEPSPLLIYPAYADPVPRLRYAGPGRYAVVTSSGDVRLGTAPGTVVYWDPDAKRVAVVADTWDPHLTGNEAAVEAFVAGLMAGGLD